MRSHPTPSAGVSSPRKPGELRLRLMYLLPLAVVLGACSMDRPTVPAAPTAGAVSRSAAAVAEPYFLFGHQNTAHHIWRVATDGSAAVVDIGPTGFATVASGMGTSRAPTVVHGGTIYPAGTHFGLLESSNGNWVYVIDTNDGHAVPIVKTSRDIRGRGIDFGPDGKTLYVIEDTPGELSTVDLVTGAVTHVASTVVSTALEWDPARRGRSRPPTPTRRAAPSRSR